MLVTIDTDTLDVNGLSHLHAIMPDGQQRLWVYELYQQALEMARCPECRHVVAFGDRYDMMIAGKYKGRKVHEGCAKQIRQKEREDERR